MTLWRDRRSDPAGWAQRRRQAVLWAGGFVAIAVLCWIQPVLEAMTSKGGNLRALWRASKVTPPEGTLEADLCIRLLARVVSLPPFWWPPGFGSPTNRAVPELPLAIASLVVLLSALAWAIRSGLRRDDRLVTGAAVASLAAVIVAYVSLLRAPLWGMLGLVQSRFLWPVSMLVWLSLTLAVGRALGPRLGDMARRRVVVGATALCLVVGAATIPVVDHRGRPLDQLWQPMATDMADAVEVAVDGEDMVLVRHAFGSNHYEALGPYLMAELAERGVTFCVESREMISQVGEHRRRSAEHPPTVALSIRTATPPPGDSPWPGREIYRYETLRGADREEFERLTSELEGDLEANPLTLPPDIREELAADPKSRLAEFEADVAGGNLTLERLRRMRGILAYDLAILLYANRLGPEATEKWTRWGVLYESRADGVVVYLEDL